MQRLPVEAWTAILCITAGPLDDLDEMTGAEGDVSSWRTCLRVEIVSKGVWQHVHPCIAQMQVSHPRQLQILAWKIEGAVKYFAALENQWLNEPDSLQQETLYKSVFDAEVAFAVKFEIYSHLVTGNQKEVSVAKDKTRNRMRTRLKNKCCIGLPVQGRAMKREKTKKVVRMRVDPETRQIVSWLSFQQRHKTTTPDDLVGLWKKLPRVMRPSKARWWAGEAMTWSQCMDKYLDFFDMSSLYTWYLKLPRAD